MTPECDKNSGKRRPRFGIDRGATGGVGNGGLPRTDNLLAANRELRRADMSLFPCTIPEDRRFAAQFVDGAEPVHRRDKSPTAFGKPGQRELMTGPRTGRRASDDVSISNPGRGRGRVGQESVNRRAHGNIEERQCLVVSD